MKSAIVLVSIFTVLTAALLGEHTGQWKYPGFAMFLGLCCLLSTLGVSRRKIVKLAHVDAESVAN